MKFSVFEDTEDYITGGKIESLHENDVTTQICKEMAENFVAINI